MGKYRICVYAICKNEEEFVDRWVESMKEADLIIVTDTGSIDNSVEKLRKAGVKVYINKIDPWRFDIARNISLSHVPKDVDICVCTDIDEVFEKGWRKKLEETWSKDTTICSYIYNWSLKSDGRPDVQFHYSKIHERNGYKWKYPIHECLIYIGKKTEKKAFIKGMILNHYPDSNKSRSSYLPLLELAVKELPEDERMMYYLGREYMYTGEWEKSINTLKRYLLLPSSLWEDERSASMRWIAKCYKNTGNIKEAINWYFKAIAEVPMMRDSYIECAQVGYEIGDWDLVFFMTKKALEIKEKSTTYINMGYSWDETPYDLAAISCFNLGLYEKAQKNAENALKIVPNDKRLKNNLQLIKKKTQQ